MQLQSGALTSVLVPVKQLLCGEAGRGTCSCNMGLVLYLILLAGCLKPALIHGFGQPSVLEDSTIHVLV